MYAIGDGFFGFLGHDDESLRKVLNEFQISSEKRRFITSRTRWCKIDSLGRNTFYNINKSNMEIANPESCDCFACGMKYKEDVARGFHSRLSFRFCPFGVPKSLPRAALN